MAQSKILIELSTLFPTQPIDTLEQILLFRKSQCRTEEKLLQYVIEDILLSNTEKIVENKTQNENHFFEFSNENEKNQQNRKRREKQKKKQKKQQKEIENKEINNYVDLSNNMFFGTNKKSNEIKKEENKMIQNNEEKKQGNSFALFQPINEKQLQDPRFQNNYIPNFNFGYPFTENGSFSSSIYPSLSDEDDPKNDHFLDYNKEKNFLNFSNQIQDQKIQQEQEQEQEQEKAKVKETIVPTENKSFKWTFLNRKPSFQQKKKQKPRPKKRNLKKQIKGIEKYLIQLFPKIPKVCIQDIIKQYQDHLIFNETEAIQQIINFLTESFLTNTKIVNEKKEKKKNKRKHKKNNILEFRMKKEEKTEYRKNININENENKNKPGNKNENEKEKEKEKENRNENEKENENEQGNEKKKEKVNENYDKNFNEKEKEKGKGKENENIDFKENKPKKENNDLENIEKIIEIQQEFTIQKLFYQVLEIFPDIEHQFLYNFICGKIDLPEEDFEEQYEIKMKKRKKNKNKNKNKNNHKILCPKKVVTYIANLIMNLKNFPKQPKGEKGGKDLLILNNKYKNINWFENKDPVDKIYQKEALLILLQKFPKLSTTMIKRELRNHGFRYAPTYKDLKLIKNPEKMNNFFANLFNRKNNEIKLTSIRLIIETKYVQDEEQKKIEKIDLELAEKINEDEYEQSGCKIDCMCCYAKVPFEKMVSCKAGHLFCVDCLHNLVKHAIGTRKKEIRCPGVDKCDFGFSLTMIQKAVPEKTWDLFERLVQESEINQAKIENLRKCPNCDYAEIIEDIQEVKILKCKNPKCLSKTCLFCNEKAHPGKTCEEFKKDKKVDHHRLFIEEQMTKALLRTCNNCNQMYYKTQGCNKIVCSNCGEIMCYLCQKSINQEKYKHFSKTGDKCRLWTTEEEDLIRVQIAEKEAIETVKNLKADKETEKDNEIYRIEKEDEKGNEKEIVNDGEELDNIEKNN
ncbi:e3 ubiquitin-protein ligase [Anaeramoeba flamelloides]|uniref:E3 ubiquitin-protein ligase n=1 Tax=Anaeramoeba flamelloides TaxID=1746091 RepID=A0AAV7YLN4_9EUKA|nr:e3 ubiquitin-protein ligase [Anaeramoeba flamelloides]